MEEVETKKTRKKKEEPKAVSLLELIRHALLLKKFRDVRWGTSKHTGSRYYLSVSARRRAKKVQRMNRKAGR